MEKNTLFLLNEIKEVEQSTLQEAPSAYQCAHYQHLENCATGEFKVTFAT